MQQKWNQNFDGEPMADIPQKFLNAGCDVYMVMQLRHDEKILDERFASMRELHRRGKTPDPEHYEVTYYADLPAMWQDVPNNEILEELFQMFNLSRPQDFEGHRKPKHLQLVRRCWLHWGKRPISRSLSSRSAAIMIRMVMHDERKAG